MWQQVWNELVEELVPDEFKPGFRDQLDPEMGLIMQTFLNTSVDAKVKSDIKMLSDFLEWSLISGLFSKIPAWVYIYHSVLKQGLPVSVACEIDCGNRALITQWVRSMTEKTLLTWSIGIRAIQLLRGSTFYLPVEIARAVLEEISLRSNKSFSLAWLKRRGTLLKQ